MQAIEEKTVKGVLFGARNLIITLWTEDAQIQSQYRSQM